jgi:hypothetical protein
MEATSNPADPDLLEALLVPSCQGHLLGCHNNPSKRHTYVAFYARMDRFHFPVQFPFAVATGEHKNKISLDPAFRSTPDLVSSRKETKKSQAQCTIAGCISH